MLGKKLKEIRDRLNLTQGEMSILMEKKSEASYRNYEDGRTEPRVSDIGKLVDIGVSIGFIYGISNNPFHDNVDAFKLAREKLEELKK